MDSWIPFWCEVKASFTCSEATLTWSLQVPPCSVEACGRHYLCHLPCGQECCNHGWSWLVPGLVEQSPELQAPPVNSLFASKPCLCIKLFLFLLPDTHINPATLHSPASKRSQRTLSFHLLLPTLVLLSLKPLRLTCPEPEVVTLETVGSSLLMSVHSDKGAPPLPGIRKCLIKVKQSKEVNMGKSGSSLPAASSEHQLLFWGQQSKPLSVSAPGPHSTCITLSLENTLFFLWSIDFNTAHWLLAITAKDLIKLDHISQIETYDCVLHIAYHDCVLQNNLLFFLCLVPLKHELFSLSCLLKWH